MSGDTRGPLRVTIAVAVDARGKRWPIMECGHALDVAQHFSYTEGERNRCFRCGCLERGEALPPLAAPPSEREGAER